MNIEELFAKLRQLAGADITLRIDTIVQNASVVQVEQAGSSQLEQVRITLMLPDLTKSTYYKMQALLGRPVNVQFGQIEDSVVFESMTTIPTDGRFDTEKNQPVSMTFTVPVDAAELSASLRAAGFKSYAEEIAQLALRANKTGSTQLRAAIAILKRRKKFALADRIASLYEEMYDESAEEKNSEQDLSDDNKDNKRVPQTVDETPALINPPRGSTE